MQWALDLVCTHVGWPLGLVLTTTTDPDTLTCAGIWHDEDPDRYAPVVEVFKGINVRRGEALSGQVLADGRAAWIEANDDRVLPEIRSAVMQSGIHAAFAFPIVSDRGIEGVIEVLGAERVELAEDQLELFAHVGLQVGGAIERERTRRELRDAERLAHIGSWSWDVVRDTVECSRELFVMHGFDPDEAQARPTPFGFGDFLTVIHPDDHEPLQLWAADVIASGEPRDIEYRVRVGRAIRWIHVHAQVAEWRGDQVVRLAGYDQDITVRRRAEERRRRVQRELAHQQRVLERIARGEPLNETLNVLCRFVERNYPDARCSVLLLDRAAGILRTAAGPSLPPDFHAAIDGLPVGDGIACCGTAAARGEVVVIEDTFTHEYTAPFLALAQTHNLRSVWSHPLRKMGGEVLGTFALYRGTTHRPSKAEIKAVLTTGSLAALAIERSQSESALLTAANLDSLTGLPNRARFLELVNEQLHVPGRRVTVLFLDLARFKVINDSLGHLAGDRILIEIAGRLQRAAGGSGVVARFGGDVFTVMVRDADATETIILADALQRAVEAPIVVDGGEFFLSATVGIATNDHQADAYGLVRDADAAMHAAKGRGSTGHEVFDQRLRTQMLERLARENDLRRAIERNELVLHYQPVLDVVGRRWEGVEALVRWQHPTEGLLYPDSFIPLAEETGLIVPLGARVLDMVVAQAAAWAETLPGIHIAVNASAVQLADPAFAEDLLRMLEVRRLRSRAVIVEVTESAVMQELDAARVTLERLIVAGVGVHIDDFGTGYSSIARLGELPVTGLKIDRKFTMALGTDANAGRVLAAISDLARAYRLQVVAEGIEDAGALEYIATLGCDFAQGYHLGRPAPADVVERLLAQPPAATRPWSHTARI
jgi:diguanylate cyclase (GGDEF)-like protein